jgi:hypothetical protein
MKRTRQIAMRSGQAALFLVLAAAAGAGGDTAGTLHHSFDVTVQRGGGGSVFDDEMAIEETTAPAWSAVALGGLPAAAELRGLHHARDGRWYFSLDTFAHLGTIDAGPEDVVAWNGSTYALVFDGSAAGVPAGVGVDAVAQAPGLGLLLSFDGAFAIAGPVLVEDEDVVAWNGAALAPVFDGSSAGVAAALDLDGLDVDGSDDSVYLSFDGSGRLGGVDFDDHDLLHFDGVTWAKVPYAGLAEPGTAAADLEDVDYVTVGIFSDDFESENTLRWTL